MKKTLSKIVEDLARGKNLPHYALVLVALMAIVARTVDAIPDSLVSAVILAIVTLLLTKMIGMSWRLGEIVPDKELQVCQHWHVADVKHSLERASNSIVLVQSWFPDAAVLADSIKSLAASHTADAPLVVKIYMLDPKSPFGAQRYAQLHGLDASSDVEKAERGFRASFDESVNSFRMRLKDHPGLKVSIRTYTDATTVKVYVVDGNEYVFGWLGADEGSTGNVCFKFSNGSSPELKVVADRLNAHISTIDAKSRELWPAEHE